MIADSYPQLLLALCLWREARGQSREAKLAVKHVILNRAANPKGPYRNLAGAVGQGEAIVRTILQPFQFSSFLAKDPNSSRLPQPTDAGEWRAWLECCEVVDSSDADPTGGATHYFSVDIPVPAWADPTKRTCAIGAFRFYRL